MTAIGNPFGVDPATTIFGAGLSLVVSAGAMLSGVPEWIPAELIGMVGATLVILGTLYGLVLMIFGAPVAPGVGAIPRPSPAKPARR